MSLLNASNVTLPEHFQFPENSSSVFTSVEEMNVNFVCQQNTYFWILNVLVFVVWCVTLGDWNMQDLTLHKIAFYTMYIYAYCKWL